MANQLTSGKVALAFTVAILADFIQLPLNALALTGFLALPSEAVDIVVDIGAFGLTAALLGFHWALLPTALFETLPFLDAFPTWTGCVAFVVYQRKQGVARHAASRPVEVASLSMSPTPMSEVELLRPMRQVEAITVQSSKGN